MKAMEDEIQNLRGIFFTYLILKTSRIINSGIKEGEFNFDQYIFIYRVICACTIGNIMLTIVKFAIFLHACTITEYTNCSIL